MNLFVMKLEIPCDNPSSKRCTWDQGSIDEHKSGVLRIGVHSYKLCGISQNTSRRCAVIVCIAHLICSAQ